jgi:general secretion pathway protein J
LHAGANADSGFTLLEILVALVVFGFLMAGLSQAIHFGLNAWTSQSQTIARDGDLYVVDRLLRGLIERIEPGQKENSPNVVGTSSSVVFTSILPAGASTLPIRRADMLLRVEAGRGLVLQWTPHPHVKQLAAGPPPATTTVLAGVTRLEVSYYSQAGGWRGQWNDRTPPELVRLRFVFAKGDPRHWPDLVAAPQLRGEDG